MVKYLGHISLFSIRIFLKSEIGCKDLYQLLVYNSKQIITAVTKWQVNGIFFSEKKLWSSVFELSFKVKQERKLRWLQFQILHRTVLRNEYFFKLNILNSLSYTFCKNYIETIEHLCMIVYM